MTYLTVSAPYLATTLMKPALDEGETFPTASSVLIEDTYIDVIMTGGKTIQEAIQLRCGLMDLPHHGKFHFRKWCTNDPDILAHIPAENVATASFEVEKDVSIKTFGIIWNPKRNTFQFAINLKNTTLRTTKLSISSPIRKIFDPLGLIGPVILIEKLIVQQLWSYQIGWDEEIPDE